MLSVVFSRLQREFPDVLARGMLVAVGLIGSTGFAAQSPTVVVQWDQAILQGVRDSKLTPPIVARALAITHTCMYEAFAAYDQTSLGLLLGERLRRPAQERTAANMEKAISYAAYRCVVDLMPWDQASVYEPLMRQLGYDSSDQSQDPATPQGIGNLSAAAVLTDRRADGANQFGDLTAGGVAYADYSGYTPVNPPSTVPVNPATVVDVNRWQPLQYVDVTGTFVTQKYFGGFWPKVRPFALTSFGQFRSVAAGFGPARYGTPEFLSQAQELIDFSANLTDKQKMIAEYWADGPLSETPPGHWALLAQYVSARDHHTVADDARMYFALTNALFDAGIAAWDVKSVYDSVRPVTAISYLFQHQTIRSWGGPGRGTVSMDGSQWIPYQASYFPTPPFAEFISGHSTFSAAAAEVLRLFSGSDIFGAEATFAPGTSKYEPGVTPQSAITLRWPTFTAAADEAGLSRRYGGIHFRAGDLAGRAVGLRVGRTAWRKAESLWSGGTNPNHLHGLEH